MYQYNFNQTGRQTGGGAVAREHVCHQEQRCKMWCLRCLSFNQRHKPAHSTAHPGHPAHPQDKNIKIQISKNIIHKNYKLQKRSQKITQNHTTYSSSCAACGFDRHLLRDCATTTPLRHGNRKPETSVGPQVRTFTTSCARRGLLSSG